MRYYINYFVTTEIQKCPGLIALNKSDVIPTNLPYKRNVKSILLKKSLLLDPNPKTSKIMTEKLSVYIYTS